MSTERTPPGAVLLEVCVDSLAGLERARAGGAQRLEVCARLELGGLTPTPEFLRACLAGPLECFAMIRPRAGDFVYDVHEARALQSELSACAQLGAHGFVLGALKRSGQIDRDLVAACVALASPLPVTFHRAFDATGDLEQALETLIELGVSRVLTAGGAPDAYVGRERLADLVERARGRIGILAGGGVRAHNAAAIVSASGVRELHSSTSFQIAAPGQ